jgi:hypothetical protein
MRFKVDIDVPGRFMYLFGHSTKWLVVKSLAPGADIIHRCFADEGVSILTSLSTEKIYLAAFLTSIGADCIRMNRRT